MLLIIDWKYGSFYPGSLKNWSSFPDFEVVRLVFVIDFCFPCRVIFDFETFPKHQILNFLCLHRIIFLCFVIYLNIELFHIFQSKLCHPVVIIFRFHPWLFSNNLNLFLWYRIIGYNCLGCNLYFSFFLMSCELIENLILHGTFEYLNRFCIPKWKDFK